MFYASGRASLETSYMWALLARLYGNNNLPDSSNMCHEPTSVALPQSIGAPVGTVLLEDFETTDLIFFFGQNVGSNAPRMLHPLQEARRRGAQIITFNPLRERGLERFTNPQSPVEMADALVHADLDPVPSGEGRRRPRGAHRPVQGPASPSTGTPSAAGRPGVLDHAFIAEHTHGFDGVRRVLRRARTGLRSSGAPASRARPSRPRRRSTPAPRR